MKRLLIVCLAAFAVAGCDVQPIVTAPTGPAGPAPEPVARQSGGGTSLSDFRRVVDRVEPVAESACRQLTAGNNCNLNIFVAESDVANAYQSYENGRPVIVFTTALFEEFRNRDEMAFALAHEAAHHIEGHVVQTERNARVGALFGVLAGSLAGFDQQGVTTLRDVGGFVGARRYSKEFELEADSLGAVIARRAGFDPVRGVQYFARAADPGDRFLGTHPPNADRISTVRRALGQ